MTLRRKSSAASLASRSAELAFAVPQVVAHRLTRLALAGPKPSPRDRREFERMVAEKRVAFSESWAAMALAAARAQQAWARSAFAAFWSFGTGLPSAVATARRLRRDGSSVLASGLAPVHRKAVANAKRLARTRRR